MAAQTSGISAEVNADGPVMNIIPKEGGNTFNVIGSGLFTNHKLESSNLTDELRARGFTDGEQDRTSSTTSRSSVGGPIKRDKTLVLRGAAHMGLLQAERRRLLEQDPERRS